MITLPLTSCRRAARTIRYRRVIHLGKLVHITWTGHFSPSGELDEVELTPEGGRPYTVQGTELVSISDDILGRDWFAAEAALRALAASTNSNRSAA